MTTVQLNLPKGSEQRGELYRDKDFHYGMGDVLEVELPTGYVIDVGWDESEPERPFQIVVYREYFGDQHFHLKATTVDEVACEVQRLAAEYSSETGMPSQSRNVGERHPIQPVGENPPHGDGGRVGVP